MLWFISMLKLYPYKLTYHDYHAFHAFAMLYRYSHANKAHCCCRCFCFNKANLFFKWRVFEPTHFLFAPLLLSMNHQWLYQPNVERLIEWLLNWTSNEHLVEYKICNQIWSRTNLILLVPLDKNPGVRPIGVGEVLRRIIGKTTSAMFKEEIKEAVGPLQVCAGHSAGSEAAIHAMNQVFNEEGADRVLLIDATNAFNQMNRTVAMRNTRITCKEIALYIIKPLKAVH